MKYRISFTSDPWELTAYSDADWAGDIDTLRLNIGFVVFLGKNPISWQSKKHSYVSRSSTEAEYRALDLKVYLPQPPLLDCVCLGTEFKLRNSLLIYCRNLRLGSPSNSEELDIVAILETENTTEIAASPYN
ncbi:unnamed protein product [Prunus armeniaca]